MNELICAIKATFKQDRSVPFTVYSSMQVQQICNVPIIKPVLIVVLDGEKRLGKTGEIVCSAGSFVFLSNSPMLDMRNIPSEREYFALLIEFEQKDFSHFEIRQKTDKKFFTGNLTKNLEALLQQFIEWSAVAPPELWPNRRIELLQYLDYLGYHQVRAMAGNFNLSQTLSDIFRAHLPDDIGITELCELVAMSESTLRRKLQAEGTSVQEIKDQTRLGHGLHLLQTSSLSIGVIADLCGYQSQSRFSERFKHRFGLTPTELRKTKTKESGEDLAVYG